MFSVKIVGGLFPWKQPRLHALERTVIGDGKLVIKAGEGRTEIGG